mgnify:FL=1
MVNPRFSYPAPNQCYNFSMKESHGIPAAISKGETLATKAQERAEALPLVDPRVQVSLALQAFPGENNVMGKWLEMDSFGASLSSRFRAYIEDKDHGPSETEIRLNDTEALKSFLQKVREHAPEQTIH